MLSDAISWTTSFSGCDVFWRCLLLTVVIRAGIVVYRLFFHPLRCVPGPRFAAATSLYLRYHEVAGYGGLTKSLPNIHKIYKSDIVRIAPNHVHINEPGAYRRSDLLATSHVYDAYMSGVQTIVTADDPQRHRAMRNAAAPFFSSREMDYSFHKGRNHIQRAADSMVRKGREGEPVNLHSYFQAIMTNIVAETVLDCPRQLVSYDSPTSGWMALHHSISRNRWLIGDIPFLVPMGLSLLELFPEWIGAISGGFKDLYEHCKKVGHEILIARKANDYASSTTKHQTLLLLEHDHRTQDLTNSDASALFQQAAVFLLAGASPAITLTVACFNILKSAHIKEQLRDELEALDTYGGILAPEFDWRRLTRLRYLDAFIKECLRIIPPIPGLLPRVVPCHGMEIGSHFIPPGTRISAAQFVFHHNENIFPSPGHFDPERWLKKSPEELQIMDQYFIPFGKGSRACIGWQHAYIYMFIAIAYILNQFEMEPTENPPDMLDWKDQTGAVPVAPPLVWLRPRNQA